MHITVRNESEDAPILEFDIPNSVVVEHDEAIYRMLTERGLAYCDDCNRWQQLMELYISKDSNGRINQRCKGCYHLLLKKAKLGQL